MTQRKIAEQQVSAIGLGCMNLSHAYGTPPAESDATRLLHEAIDAGVSHFDTAALYGFGNNEKLLGRALKAFRSKLFLASKCGMTGVDGKRVIDGHPKTIRATVEQSLRHLQTDVLDLCYLHRWDKKIPIEDSVGEMSRLVEEGKILTLGLSEVSASTLETAHKVHPIAALQTEYSLWTRNPEIAVLDKCLALGVTFVAFSPLARGFLTGTLKHSSDISDGDIRKAMPRFESQHMANNLPLLSILQDLSEQHRASMGQIALAWLLHKSEHIVPIPGTTSIAHLHDNLGAVEIKLTETQIKDLDQTFDHKAISGARYNQGTQAEIDTEEYQSFTLPSLITYVTRPSF